MPTVDDIRWFKQAFRARIEAALLHDPFDLDMVVAIACQETGNVWPVLRKKGLSLDRILALCVGDTIDKGRTAFPKTKGELVAWPQGEEMFAIARHALEDMATYIPGYGGAVGNPDKFCHGFGVFQRDLQHFKVDPEYFLEKRYEVFEDALAQCLVVLRHGVAYLGFESKTKLTDEEFAMVAIVYNTGKFIKGKALKQGYKSGGKYYGEWIHYFIGLSRKVDAAPLGTAAHFVIARDGLKLRGGPGTDFTSERTLPTGTRVFVVGESAQDPDWVLVDLQGDGLRDGYMFAPYLSRSDADDGTGEDAPEPG